MAKVQFFLKKFHATNHLKAEFQWKPLVQVWDGIKIFEECYKSTNCKKTDKKGQELYSLSSHSKKTISKLQTKQIKFFENYIKNSGLVPIDKTSILEIKVQVFRSFRYNSFLKSKDKIEDIDNKFLIHKDYFFVLLDYLRKYFYHSNELTIKDFKKCLESQETAIPLLEHLDKAGYTIRKKDIRILGPNLYD